MRSLLAFGLLAVFAGCTTTMPAPSEDLEVRALIETPGVARDDLSVKTIAWLLDKLPSAKFTLRDEDKTRVVTGTGRTEFTGKNGALIPCDYTLTIEIEDGQERLTFDNWIGQWGDLKDKPEPITDDRYAAQVRAKLRALANGLESYLKASGTRR